MNGFFSLSLLNCFHNEDMLENMENPVYVNCYFS